jgi:hypothetical protein
MLSEGVQLKHCSRQALHGGISWVSMLYICCPALSLTQACLQEVKLAVQQTSGEGMQQIWHCVVFDTECVCCMYAAEHCH